MRSELNYDIGIYAKVCELEDHLSGLGIDLPDGYEPIERLQGDWREMKADLDKHRGRYDKLIAERKHGEEKIQGMPNYYQGSRTGLGG